MTERAALRIGDVARAHRDDAADDPLLRGDRPAAASETREPGAHRTYGEEDVERLRELLRPARAARRLARGAARAGRGRGAPAPRCGASGTSGIEDPVRQRQILEQSLGHIDNQLALVRHRRDEIEQARRRAGDEAPPGPRPAARAGTQRRRQLRQADLAVDHRDHAAGHPGTPVHHLHLEHARPPHLLALAYDHALAAGALGRGRRPSGPAADPVAGSSPISAVRVNDPGPCLTAVGLEPDEVDDASGRGAPRARRWSSSPAGPGRGASCSATGAITWGIPVETTCGGSSGWASSAPQPDGGHHRLALELGAELGLVLQHRGTPAPFCSSTSIGWRPGHGLLHEARLGPGRASGPPRPRSRATGWPGEGQSPRAGPRSGCGSRHPRRGGLHEGRLGEPRLLGQGEHGLARSPRPRQSTTASPLPASGRSAKTSSQEIRWFIPT